jgi:hypothetical protein
MGVAILGGGFQGCCLAMALALRGRRVSLYEQNAILLAGAATASEGKIHLGYTYAADRSLTTARMLMRGAMAFAPQMRRYLDADEPWVASEPFLYAVHRDSQVTAEQFAGHLDATHHLIQTIATRDSYFGINLSVPQRLTSAALKARFDPAYVIAAFGTSEIAIDTTAMAESIRKRIAQDPKIDVRPNRRVTAVENEGARLRVRSTNLVSGEVGSESYDAVVNALWDGRLAIDATRGIHPGRKWIYRFKHGIRFRLAEQNSLPSVTIVLGPFGDVVAYRDGSYYISWYPACMTAHSEALSPPAWQSDDVQSSIVTKSFAGMGAIVPELCNVRPYSIRVKGGVIVAWGSTDIDDHTSELHRRYDIGVHSYDRYHSIDPGKFTMAPYFAEICADRVSLK